MNMILDFVFVFGFQWGGGGGGHSGTFGYNMNNPLVRKSLYRGHTLK